MRLREIVQRGRQLAKRGIEVPAISAGGYGGFFGTGLFGQNQQQEGIDFNREARIRWDSSIVFAVLEFACRNIEAIPLKTYTRSPHDGGEVVPDHPCTVICSRPNPWYDGVDLANLSIMCEMGFGASYSYLHRDPYTLEVVAIEYLPEGCCYPYSWPGSGQFISEYRVSTPSGYLRVPPRDILPILYKRNPQAPLYGMSPLESCFPEMVADRMAARHEASILDNGAVASSIVSPRQLTSSGDPESPIIEFSAETARQLEQRFKEKLTRDAKGAIHVSTIPLDFHKIAFDPEQLNLEYTTGKAETRICSVFGFQPVALGFGVGLRESNNRASISGAINFTFKNGILPYMRRRARQLTFHLIPELGRPGEVIMYDESQVEELKRAVLLDLLELTGRPVLTTNEGRAMAGREPIDDPSCDQIPGAKGEPEQSKENEDNLDPETQSVKPNGKKPPAASNGNGRSNGKPKEGKKSWIYQAA